LRAVLIHTSTFDDISGDADFIALREKLAAEPVVRRFVPSVIRTFWGGLRTPESLIRYAAFWGQKHPTSDPRTPAAISEAATLLTALYTTWSGRLGNLRGALIEGLVLAQLDTRYSLNRLADNVTLTLENGIEYTSITTIDVVGWDGNRGECHDCKARAKRVDIGLVRDLEQNLPQPEFRVGVVTTDSGPVMAAALRELGYVPAPGTELIPLERLWDLAPLQRPGA
jgi:hypothetical protein